MSSTTAADEARQHGDSPTLYPSDDNRTPTQSLKPSSVRDDGSTVFTDIGRLWQIPLFSSENTGEGEQQDPDSVRTSPNTTSTAFTDIRVRPEQDPEQSQQQGDGLTGSHDPSVASATSDDLVEIHLVAPNVHMRGLIYGANPDAQPEEDPFHIPFDTNRLSALQTDSTWTPTGRASAAETGCTSGVKKRGRHLVLSSVLCCFKASHGGRRANAASRGPQIGLTPHQPSFLQAVTTRPESTEPVDDRISRVDFAPHDPMLDEFPMPPGSRS